MRHGFQHPAMSLSRRELLRMGALGGAIVLQSGARALPRRAPGPGRDVLVLVALRGGFDGLSFCVPTGDGDYYAQRPNTGVAAAQTLPLGGLFGLNAAAAPLHGRYQSGQLAFVHACGLAHPTRSHFEAIRRVEEASVTGGPVGSGWVGRYLASQAPANPTPGRAIAVDRVLPQAMEGGPATLTIPKLKDFDLEGPASTKAARAARLRRMYEAREGAERDGGLTALGLLNTLTSIDFAGRTPGGGAVYPGNKFGQGLYETASLVKAQAGIEVVEVDFGGWDDHSSMGAVSGEYAARIQLLSAGLEAFLADLGADADRTTVIVHSEFGRRVDENGSGGTDHGRGGLVMVLGGSQVRGGQVHGAWPGLAPAVLDDGAVPVRTDIREVIAATLTERMGASAATLAVTLPGYSGGSSLDLFV